MELTILGGAAACPNPGQGSSAYLLAVDGQHWLIDCGSNILQELRKHVEIDQIEHIWISHTHSDHTLDLVPLRYGLKYDPGVGRVRPGLHLPPEGKSFLGRVATAFAMGAEGAERFFDDQFHVEEYDPSAELVINSVSVRFLRTDHPVPCWAMRIESAGGTLVYLADTGPRADLLEFARDADILICEGTYPDDDSVSGVTDRPHLTAFESGQLARDAGARAFVLTHLWQSVGYDQYLEAATEGFGGQVTLARPGVKIATR